MTRIEVNFDELMYFGKIHSDVGRSIDLHRSVFRADNARLDQIIDSFRLTRHSTQFGGMTVTSAMGDSDSRAGRVAHTLMISSSRLYTHAGVVNAADSHFDYWAAVFTPGVIDFVGQLASFVGGKVADVAVAGAAAGTMAPWMMVLAPVFIVGTSVIGIVHGASVILDATADVWDKVGGSLEALAGIGAFAEIVVSVGLVAAGVVSLAGALAVAAPVLIVAAAVGVVAAIIENRHEIWDAAQKAWEMLQPVRHAMVEAAHDVLTGVQDLWHETVNFGHAVIFGSSDAKFSTAESIHNALVQTGKWVALPFTEAGASIHKGISTGLFVAGKINDTIGFVKDFKSITQLKGFSGLFAPAKTIKVGALAVLGTGWDVAELTSTLAHHDADGYARKAIDIEFDIAGAAAPQVGLAKGAWDVGWQVGKGLDWVFGEKLGGHEAFVNSVIASKYGGTLSVPQATELGHRYDGWRGFGHFVGDNATNTADAAKSLWKKLF